MRFTPQAIADVVLVEPTVLWDARGCFQEVWRSDRFAEAGIDATFVQDNHSRSVCGTLRGLHYQLEKPQGKLVRVVSGEIYDVAVDLRRNSPTFGRWVGTTLSAENFCQLWVPPGFAHGFYVTSASADVSYKCTAFYHAPSERCLLWNDPELAITWPMTAGRPPLISAKDQAGTRLRIAETFQ
ncbi:MAG: dTDP-4-dehydrorhamnose 3,5-epimerase [Steroidobacteraceae bacterium]|nr:dTDP-4-dehydrorhamnose 3,5-epimerase [Steroidobacteraceae bacterium]